MYSFGGRGKYYFDFEIAEEILPDIYSVQNRQRFIPCYERKIAKKAENSRKKEIIEENGEKEE